MLTSPVHLLSPLLHSASDSMLRGWQILFSSCSWFEIKSSCPRRKWLNCIRVSRAEISREPCHSLPCFQASVQLLDAAQTLLQLAVIFEGLSSSNGVSNLRRRIITGAGCLQNLGIALAACLPREKCVGQSEVPDPAESCSWPQRSPFCWRSIKDKHRISERDCTALTSS